MTFTRNHASIISAINNFEGRKFDYTPRNQFERAYSRYPTEVGGAIRNQVVMGALRGLSTRLGSLREGRKSIIYVSEGSRRCCRRRCGRQNAELGASGQPRVSASCSARTTRARRPRACFAPGGPLLADARRLHRRQPQQHVDLLARSARAGDQRVRHRRERRARGQDRVSLQDDQDTLRSLSEETDGRAIVNRNDLASGLAADGARLELLLPASATTRRGAPTDGKFHEIKVRVKRRGVESARARATGPRPRTTSTRATTPRPEPPTSPKPVERRWRRSPRRSSPASTSAPGSAPSAAPTARRG